MNTRFHPLLLVLVLSSGIPVHADFSSKQNLAGLEKEIETIFHKSGLPSIVCQIVDDRASPLLSVSHGFTHRPGGSAVDPSTVYPIASISKTFTGFLAISLINENAISLDATVLDLFPEKATVWPAAILSIRLSELLTHTSGLPADDSKLFSLYQEVASSSESPLQARIKLIDSLPPDLYLHDRGSFRYSNLGFILAGATLERAGGKPYEELVRSRLLQPTNLKSALFLADGPDVFAKDTAVPHIFDDKHNSYIAADPFLSYPPAIIDPAGGLFLSATDLSHWATSAMLKLSSDHDQISSSSFKSAMLPLVTCPVDSEIPSAPRLSGYGLGWASVRSHARRINLLGHSGTHGVNLAWMLLIPENHVSIIILSNGGGPPALKAFRQILDCVLKRLPAAKK